MEDRYEQRSLHVMQAELLRRDPEPSRRLGDPLRVRVESIDALRGRVDLELA
jgi:hypothetical protein